MHTLFVLLYLKGRWSDSHRKVNVLTFITQSFSFCQPVGLELVCVLKIFLPFWKSADLPSLTVPVNVGSLVISFLCSDRVRTFFKL